MRSASMAFPVLLNWLNRTFDYTPATAILIHVAVPALIEQAALRMMQQIAATQNE